MHDSELIEAKPATWRSDVQLRAAQAGTWISGKGRAMVPTMADGRPLLPTSSLSRSLQLRVKRALDVLMALGGLVVLGPLLMVIALAVKFTSPGPVFYWQDRLGLNGRTFRLVKFRSMRLEQCDADGLRQVTSDDDRMTPIGRFIRATSIDELPQLWNILVGDMSVVGPRPMVEGQRAGDRDYREIVPYYDYRLLMRPGLTGLAQSYGLRGSTRDLASAIERVDVDCVYIQQFSIGMDIAIILRTLVREFVFGTGA